MGKEAMLVQKATKVAEIATNADTLSKKGPAEEEAALGEKNNAGLWRRRRRRRRRARRVNYRRRRTNYRKRRRRRRVNYRRRRTRRNYRRRRTRRNYRRRRTRNCRRRRTRNYRRRRTRNYRRRRTRNVRRRRSRRPKRSQWFGYCKKLVRPKRSRWFGYCKNLVRRARPKRRPFSCRCGNTSLGKLSSVTKCASAARAKGLKKFMFGTSTKRFSVYRTGTGRKAKPKAVPMFKKVKANHKCKSRKVNFGKHASVDSCAAAVHHKNKNKSNIFFIFGTGRKRGYCYQEMTRSSSCREGW